LENEPEKIKQFPYKTKPSKLALASSTPFQINLEPNMKASTTLFSDKKALKSAILVMYM
jgi:hypothetical protein